MLEQITAKVESGDEALIHKLAPQWERLFDEVRGAPFCRPEWIAAYIRSFEPQSEVVLASASLGERLLAVLPMVRKRSFFAGVPLVKLAGTANSHSIQFELLSAQGTEGEAAVHAIWHTLKQTPGWQVLELPLFALDGACSYLLDCAAKDGYPTLKVLAQNSPVLRLKGNGNGERPQIGSRHFRHELRRFARILAEETGTEPIVTRNEQPDSRLLKEFFDLEEAGWKGRKGSAINCRHDTRAFYEEIAKDASDRGYFCLHSLDAKGHMLAGAFSVTTDSGFFPMKVAYDENLRRGGPGHVLFNAIVNECCDRHIPELFFGGTDEHYKSLWTQESVPLFSAYVFSSDVRALLAYRLRNHVISPLGKLRWMLLQRMRRKQVSSKRHGGTALRMKAKSAKVITPGVASKSGSKVHLHKGDLPCA